MSLNTYNYKVFNGATLVITPEAFLASIALNKAVLVLRPFQNAIQAPEVKAVLLVLRSAANPVLPSNVATEEPIPVHP